MENLIAFMQAAVVDAQSVIRAIDTKVNYLFVLLIIPCTKLGAIYRVCHTLVDHVGVAAYILILIFAVSWLASAVFAFLSIFAIDNPAKHISANGGSGVFYSGDLFTLPARAIASTKGIPSSMPLVQHLARLPTTDDEIVKELAYEQMKLCYIRRLKMMRAAAAFYAAAVWVLSGGIIWLATLLVPVR
jgi:hypothetical protein